MINFQYARAADVADAVRQVVADPGAKFIASGTNLLDLMKEDVEQPTKLIDISRLPLRDVAETSDGGLRIGALLPNSDLAYHPLIERRYPILASAILAGASQQLMQSISTSTGRPTSAARPRSRARRTRRSARWHSSSTAVPVGATSSAVSIRSCSTRASRSRSSIWASRARRASASCVMRLPPHWRLRCTNAIGTEFLH
jgi:CO/xanthine dehydrogenase FAD-binding subunit